MVNDWPKRLEEKALHVPDPTPKPTAKEQAAEYEQVRSQAFEEAAEMEKAAWRVCNAYSDERVLTADRVARVKQAVETLRVVLKARALAKEPV